MDLGDEDLDAPEPATTAAATPEPARRRRPWVFVAAGSVVVVALVAGLIVWLLNWDDPKKSTLFGPGGYRGLKPGMTQAQALATGVLGAPVLQVSPGCPDYTFPDRPKADPAQEAGDIAAEQAAAAARRETDSLRQRHEDTSEYPAYRKASRGDNHAWQRSHQRIGRRLDTSLLYGGVSFGEDKLRIVIAPPGAHTSEGIRRDSTEAELKAAYEPRGLKLESPGRYALAVPDHPDWVLNFDVENRRVATMLLRNTAIRCVP